MTNYYIELGGILWDDDDPFLPEDVIVDLDGKIYNDLNSEDSRISDPAWEKIIKKTARTFGTAIIEVDGWDDCEYPPAKPDVIVR